MPDNFSESIRDVLADTAQRDPASPTRRDANLRLLPGKVDAVIGMRRVGKSWLLLQAIRDLLAEGVPRSAILHLEFEDERLAGMDTQHLRLIDQVFDTMHPDHVGKQRWFFFDEIQNVPGWEKYVRRLLADPKVHITITGSSAKLLSTEIATSLRGRALTTEVLPFSFRDALRHRGVEDAADGTPNQKARARLRHEFEQYRAIGGFPEAWSMDPGSRRDLLQGYLDVVLLRDILERHRVSNAPLLRALVRRLLRCMGNRVSLNGMTQDLRSMGLTFDKDAIYTLMQYVADVHLAFQVPLHTDSEKRRQVNPKKLYAIDHGLVQACIPSRSTDTGHQLENIVYLQLRRRGTVLGYHLTASQREVDFVHEHAGEQELVQACATLADAATREREVTALTEAMQETGIAAATIVTLDEEERIEVASGTIQVTPAWRWLVADKPVRP